MADIDNFAIDLLQQPRRFARLAWWVALAASGIAFICLIALILLLPLKETVVYTVLVDKSTGQSQSLTQVNATGLSDFEATKQSALVVYVTDRESYGQPGMRNTLQNLRDRSTGQAQKSFDALWTKGNEDYPPDRFSSTTIVSVLVKSVTLVSDNVGRVRFIKQLEENGTVTREQAFVANIEFVFNPETKRKLEDVWKNPFGFNVTKYTISAETLGVDR